MVAEILLERMSWLVGFSSTRPSNARNRSRRPSRRVTLRPTRPSAIYVDSDLELIIQGRGRHTQASITNSMCSTNWPHRSANLQARQQQISQIPSHCTSLTRSLHPAGLFSCSRFLASFDLPSPNWLSQAFMLQALPRLVSCPACRGAALSETMGWVRSVGFIKSVQDG